jgi:hypothetical protein
MWSLQNGEMSHSSDIQGDNQMTSPEVLRTMSASLSVDGASVQKQSGWKVRSEKFVYHGSLSLGFLLYGPFFLSQRRRLTALKSSAIVDRSSEIQTALKLGQFCQCDF